MRKTFVRCMGMWTQLLTHLLPILVIQCTFTHYICSWNRHTWTASMHLAYLPRRELISCRVAIILTPFQSPSTPFGLSIIPHSGMVSSGFALCVSDPCLSRTILRLCQRHPCNDKNCHLVRSKMSPLPAQHLRCFLPQYEQHVLTLEMAIVPERYILNVLMRPPCCLSATAICHTAIEYSEVGVGVYARS